MIKTVVIKERNRLIKNKLKNSSSLTFWNTVNNLLGKASKGQTKILENGEYLSDDQTAQAFADFFETKVKKLIGLNPIADSPAIAVYPGIAAFTREEIRKALESFKPKKSAGPDEIPLLILKSCYVALEGCVNHLFNQITTCGRIPKLWKVARIKPILKKGDSTKVENYRPISNLNSISKLFERCLLNRLSSLDTDGPNQHGFLASHSTTTAAIEIQNKLAEYLDSNKMCMIYSVDLSAAFDLIRPGIFTKSKSKLKQ